MFDERYYIQSQGASMGAKFSPSLANLYMGWWEELFLFSHNNQFKTNIAWYGRYIDDLIVVWHGSGETIGEFMKYLNNNSLNLEFTCTIQPK